MRILNVICGIAVLLNALHLAHAIHHFSSGASGADVQSPFFWVGIATAGLIGVSGALKEMTRSVLSARPRPKA